MLTLCLAYTISCCYIIARDYHYIKVYKGAYPKGDYLLEIYENLIPGEKRKASKLRERND